MAFFTVPSSITPLFAKPDSLGSPGAIFSHQPSPLAVTRVCIAVRTTEHTILPFFQLQGFPLQFSIQFKVWVKSFKAQNSLQPMDQNDHLSPLNLLGLLEELLKFPVAQIFWRWGAISLRTYWAPSSSATHFFHKLDCIKWVYNIWAPDLQINTRWAANSHCLLHLSCYIWCSSRFLVGQVWVANWNCG